MRASGVTKRSSFISRKAGRIGVQSAQADFWPELRHRSMVVLSRMHVAVPADLSAAIQADEKRFLLSILVGTAARIPLLSP